MQFIVPEISNRPWPVTVEMQQCNAETGEVSEVQQKFVAFFGDWDTKRLDELRAEGREKFPLPEGANEDNPPLSVLLARNAWLLPQLIDGWGPEVKNTQGSPVPYDKALLATMLRSRDGLPLSIGLWAAVQQINVGLPAIKNAVTSPAPGPDTSADEASAETNSKPI